MAVHDVRPLHRERSATAARSTANAASRRRSPRLVVGAADDTAEREADDVARRVVAGFRRPPCAASTRIQRSTAAPTVASVVGPDGGEVDDATSDRIVAAQRGGSPMPRTIRRRFEDAMGTDLRDVRVHSGRDSDELNTALGARAFTSGSHVFFGGGLPDVTTASGQHVLAHELTHVVQQRTGVRRIRRAVGFEFEVGSWTVEKITNDRSLSWLETGGHRSIPTADVEPYPGEIAGTASWAFTGDQSHDGTTHLEWVMKTPVPETDAGRVELERRMIVLENLNNNLIAKRSKAKIVRQHEEDGGRTSMRYRGQTVGMGKELLIQPSSEMSAEPQLTAGIALDRIWRLMENLDTQRYQTESKKHHEGRMAGTSMLMTKGMGELPMVAGGPAAVKAAFANVAHPGAGAPVAPSKELIGIVALLRTYLIGASTPKSYAKGIAPFLAKTDFAKLFSMLPEAAYYKQRPVVWANLVLTSAGMVPANDADAPLFSAGIQYVGADMPTLQTITRFMWLRRMAVEGVDFVTVEYVKQFENTKKLATHLFGFGSLGAKTDTVGPTGQETDRSAILEFRRMMGSLPYERWKDFALELFDYVREINANKKGLYKGASYF